MSQVHTAEYGFWKSPITSDRIAGQTIRFGQIAVSGGAVYWAEGRPAEKGRTVVVRWGANGAGSDLNPPPFSARSRVHEYGGGAFCVHGDTLYFTNDEDQRIYRREQNLVPVPVTATAAYRYADGVVDAAHQRLICVREDHSRSDREAENTIVAIDLSESGGVRTLVSGSDFYSDPRLSPDGSRLAWMSWNHPNMPWDGCELRVAQIQPDGTLDEARLIAGGARESIFQPEWSPDGVLYFLSDRGGWWNLHRHRDGKVEAVVAMEAEMGRPQWLFAQFTYAFESPERLVCAFHRKGGWRLAVVDTHTAEREELDLPYTEIANVRGAPGYIVFKGGSPTEPPSIVRLDMQTRKPQVLRSAFEVEPEVRRFFSVAEPIEFPTENELTAHAFYYPPHNPDYQAPGEERPPLIVACHGGPTGATSTTLSLSIQYWTSRGFGFLDVNYGGSTGYGRAYRERLNGNSGVLEVDDCVNAARYLVEQGRVDGNRLIIRGGSAGGYITLCALTFRDVFRAGASYYGISDVEALARDTHKFESRYMDSIIGPYPEQADVYRQRSPIHFAGRLSSPVILFQGSEDKIVPPNQAERMVGVLREKRIPVAYLLFEGEGHGFRRAENIQRALDAELYFYATMLLRKGLRF